MNTFVDSSDALCGSLELRRPCLVWSVRGGSHCLEFYSQPSAPKVLYHSANIFELWPPPPTDLPGLPFTKPRVKAIE